ncbi:MAG: cysteine desulfurase [Bacteroidales bacterium]|nr:cysteine desulfurase [Bacteroidales bacterium]
MFDVTAIRSDFPILNRTVYKRPLVYFDNGATTQKPKIVLDVLEKYYLENNSNIHRAVHHLSQQCTDAYEASRKTIQQYIGAKKVEEIVFTSGTTESINLVAFSFGEAFVNSGDEILISYLEHHSNIVPWQLMAERKGAVIKTIPMNEKGELVLDDLEKLLTKKTKIVTLGHVSNALGTINPVKQIIEKAHQKNIPVLVDGAQAVQHMKVDVQDLDADFYVFSGHKVFGPTGIGVLYGKEEWLENLPPYKGGGDMIKRVSFEKTTYADLPLKFEAGTTHYIGAIGLKVALDYVQSIGLNAISAYENELRLYLEKALNSIEEIKIYGTSEYKAATVSFGLKGAHPSDVGTLLNRLDIAVRTGSHCTQPLMEYYGIPGTVRASLAFYNTKEEIDYFVESLKRVIPMFS